MTHLQFIKSSEYGSQLNSHRISYESGINGLNNDLSVMTTMLTGDGSSITHFDEVVKRFGVEGWVENVAVTDTHRTTAKGMWDELNAMLAKQNTDGSVTGVMASRLQLCNKLR